MSSVAKLIGVGMLAAGIAAPVAARYQPYPQDEQPYPQDEQQYPQDEQSNPQYQQQYPGDQEAYPQEGEQYPQYQQGYPPYQQYPQTYPGYSYGQTYNDPTTAIIDQLLGSGYSVTDRQAARQCAMAAIAQAQSQYRGYSDYNPDEQDEQYAGTLRLSAITGLERRSDGLQVRGRVSTGRGYGGYGQDYNAGDLSFRCKIDYRGAVTSVQLYQSDRGH